MLGGAVQDRPADLESLKENWHEKVRAGKLQEGPTRQSTLRFVDQAAHEIAKASPLDTPTSDYLGRLYEAFEPEWFSDPSALVKWKGYMAVVSSNAIHEVMHGNVPYYTPAMADGFRLEPGEHPLVRRKALLAEYRTTTSGFQHQSISVPIGSGLYYRIGNSHPRTKQVGLVPVGEGKLLVTTNAIYFSGQAKTFRSTFKQIVRLESYLDGFGIYEANKPGKVIIPATLGDDDEGWFFYNLANAAFQRNGDFRVAWA